MSEADLSEADLAHLFRRKVGPYGHLQRVENLIGLGTWDTNYCLRIRNRSAEGWVEFKHLDQWPVGSGTPVVFPHLTVEQVLWGEARAAFGGRVWLLAQIGSAYCLVGIAVVRALFERELTAGALIIRSAVYNAANFPTRELLEVLTA